MASTATTATATAAAAAATTAAADMAARAFDVVVYGATGYTGALVGEYLSKLPASRSIRWAIAGRSEKKLAAAKARFEELGASNVAVLVANSNDKSSLVSMATSARVVLTTVGPYARYGTPLVEACVETGTAYVDLTGETPWASMLIDRFDEPARKSGAIIVPSCGFDSIPSDIGTLYMVTKMREANSCGTASVKCIQRMRGGVSGGTVHSMVNLFNDPASRRATSNPLLLCRSSEAAGKPTSVVTRTPPPMFPSRDADTRMWTAAFLMAGVNTQVVRRSACIQASRGNRYAAKQFQYDEVMGVGGAIKAYVMSFGLAFMALALFLPPFRWLLLRAVPAGTGPSRKSRDNGFMNVTLVATSDEEKPRKMIGTINGRGDPGYKLTAQMLAETAILLAQERDNLPGHDGGVLTPATACGMALATRLHDSGIEFGVSSKSGAKVSSL